MAEGIYGPIWPIDGPPPQPPVYTLLNAARVIEDVDAEQVERWMNGVAVYPFPPDEAQVHDACSSGTDRVKVEGGVIDLPEFGAMCVYLAETCSTHGIFGAGLSNDQAQARFVARANAALAAIESGAIETEFMDGIVLGSHPHLADGDGNVSDTAVDVVEGIAWLENEIADSHRAGMIHLSPALAVKASSFNLLHEGRDGKLRTINGTIVVPGTGYVGHSLPDGSAALDPFEEYAYATGPVEIRRSEVIQLPETLAEAVDRETNTVTYRVERYYVVDWDTVVQSAIRVDRTLP